MRKIHSLAIILYLLAAVSNHHVGAFEFIYRYNEGDKYRILSTVESNIYVNRRLGYRSEFLNRISFEITGVREDRASFSATYQSAERTYPIGGAASPLPSSVFTWARDYDSVFEQNRLGYIDIAGDYFMPMVRNVPVFPGRELEPGDTWSSDGTVVHDFRDNFGIEEPYRIPFTANYRYLGERVWKGNTYPAFSISYRIFYEPDPVRGSVYPRRIQGTHDQIVYWDPLLGQPTAYEENFRTILDLSDGQSLEYRGRAEAELVEAPPMDRDEIAREIAEDIESIPGASVRVSDEGIVISLENIQFYPDSAIMLPGESQKLDLIAEILLRYPERDILVGGHTALAGTADGRLRLSLERAEAVAAHLLRQGVRRPEQVVIRGYGAEQPVADNRTEEGMQRNRRVEITILEN